MGRVFSARIAIINGNPYVRPPDLVLDNVFREAGRATGPIPVRGKLNGAEFQQSLVRYLGDWRLYINGVMAKRGGLHYQGSILAIVGRTVKIEIAFDQTPRTYQMISEFARALGKNRKAKAAFEKLTYGRQKEILRYLSWLKSPEAKQRNIRKALFVLSGGKGHFMARPWKRGK